MNIEDPFTSEITKHIARCHLDWRGKGPRYDWILVDKGDNAYGIDGFLVARLCLLFTIIYKSQKISLAYVEWLDKTERHYLNNMQTVRITNRYNVISTQNIFRPIHLIPQFDQNTWKFKRCIQDYDEFWVNHYIDRHAFVTCY